MAATRYYLPTTSASPITVTPDASWNDITQTSTIRMIPKGQLSVKTTLTDSGSTVPTTTTQNWLSFQHISDPIPPQRFIGTFSMVIRCDEGDLGANATLAVSVRILSQDGGTVRGTLYSVFGTDTEFPISGVTKIVNAVAVTTVVTQPGDRIVVETGARYAAPTLDTFMDLRYGTSATSDFALTSGLTTNLNPWCEFSQDVYATNFNNYHSIKSISTGKISVVGGLR